MIRWEFTNTVQRVAHPIGKRV